MLFSTSEMSRIYNLGNPSTNALNTSDKTLERVNSYKVLGITFLEN